MHPKIGCEKIKNGNLCKFGIDVVDKIIYPKGNLYNKGRCMIKFTATDFYNDIGFMAALFYNNMLNNVDIYEIASYLNNKTYDDVLTKIIANGADNNNKKLFKNYLDALGIKFLDPKRAVAAKVFYYILHDKIDLGKGLRFLNFRVVAHGNFNQYLGEDIGIEQIFGNYYAISDRNVTNEKDIQAVRESIFRDMQQYVRDNLVEFPVNNIKNTLKDNTPKAELEK
jgi:hypothetical protein